LYYFTYFFLLVQKKPNKTRKKPNKTHWVGLFKKPGFLTLERLDEVKQQQLLLVCSPHCSNSSCEANESYRIHGKYNKDHSNLAKGGIAVASPANYSFVIARGQQATTAATALLRLQQ